MGLGEVTRATTYTKDTAHRPPSHMTFDGKGDVCERVPKKVG
jgi:hypothetical protein